MTNNESNFSLENIGIEKKTIECLNKNNVYSVEELWNKKRTELKVFGLSNEEINQIIIRLQLKGMDLNKKIY